MKKNQRHKKTKRRNAKIRNEKEEQKIRVTEEKRSEEAVTELKASLSDGKKD